MRDENTRRERRWSAEAEFGPGPRGRHGGRRRRGEIRTAVLAVLTDGPAHGYQIIQTLEERSGGRWRPSPGSVYPTLQLLQDEGLVEAAEHDGKRVFSLTEEGRTEAETRLREADEAPWQQSGRGQGHGDLRGAAAKLHQAARQVGVSGSPEQVERAVEILRQARRDLYQLLAED